MKFKKEELELIHDDILARSNYLIQNATPIEREIGTLDTVLQPRQEILNKIEEVLKASTDTDKTPDKPKQ